MRTHWTLMLLAAICLALTAPAGSDVFNLPDGLTSLEFVTVGDPGNAGELSGMGAGGYGPDRICGAVDYTYNIGKFKVTASQYTEFLNAVAATDTYGLYNLEPMWTHGRACRIERSGSPGSYSYSVAPDWANRPAHGFDWGGAARFCNWLHNGQPTGVQDLSTTEDGSYFFNGAVTDEALLAVTRKTDATYVIPSEDEWYKAAYYDGNSGVYHDYPTGTDATPSNVLVDPDPGNSANFTVVDRTVGPPYYTTEVGEFENSASSYETFDQGGNLHEWHEGRVDPVGRGLRGGGWGSAFFNLRANGRGAGSPTNLSGETGFRVALVPEPATLSLFIAGAVCLSRRRRVR